MEVDPSSSATSTSKHVPSDSTVTASVVLSKGAAAASASSGLSVALHPLVIMNVSEHWTRNKAQEGRPVQVYGALIGKQKGRNIEIMNSFELDHSEIDGKVVIDRDYYTLKEGQFKQVFSEMDFLGWYTTGEKPSENEIHVHRQICEINESPLFMLLNPGSRTISSGGDLPVSMFESIIDLVLASNPAPAASTGKKQEMPPPQPAGASSAASTPASEARMLFLPLSYTLATEDAERIGLDHVARISGASDDTKSKVSEHVLVQHSAIKMLASRVRVILEYVKAVESGQLPMNHEILREAKALANRLPVLESDRFKPEFYTQCNDAALVAYLGTVMKSCSNLNQFINKFNVLYQRQGPGRRMRGLFF